jgi:hypothetical protein
MRTLQRAREESNLQPPGPQPSVLSIELRALGGEGGIRTRDCLTAISAFQANALDQLCDLSWRTNYSQIELLLPVARAQKL